MDGYIKLYRKLLENPVFQNEKLLKVFIWCLLKATHKEREQLIGLQKVQLKPGQFVFGRVKAAKELKIKESSVNKYMMWLKKERILDIKSNNKFSLVTIENWALYQSEDSESNSKNDNKVTAKEQQSNTNKNVKNEKNGNKGNKYRELIQQFTLDPELQKTILDYIEMREAKKKPPTERALQDTFKKLAAMAGDIPTQIRILEQSIMYCWTGIFPLKDQKPSSSLDRLKQMYEEVGDD